MSRKILSVLVVIAAFPALLYADNELLLFSSRQACAGLNPAVLLGWSMPQGADPFVTIVRSDSNYRATVNTAAEGAVHDVVSGLIFGNVYRFRVEAQVGGITLVSNELEVPITSDECRLSVATGDLPHPPILRAKPAFCENGVAKVELFWTEATGAQSYSLQRVNVFAPTVLYEGITGRSFKDEIPPGGAASYKLSAHNSGGSVNSWNVGVIVPGIVCSTSGAPGPFAAGAENLVCDEGQGSVTVQWGQSAGAATDYRVYEFYDHQLVRLSDEEDDFIEELGLLDPGVVIRAVVQAQSATVPGKFREAYPLARLVPLELCGSSAVRPTVGGPSASYIRANQALLRAGVIANRSQTTAYFEWGTSTAYDFQTPPKSIGNKYNAVTLGEVLSGLSCDTTYHYRVVAINANGRTDGADQVFTTSPCSTANSGSFYSLTPCRLVDTRSPTDPNGPAIAGNESRTLTFINKCGIPSDATGVSFNVTVVNPTASGFLSLHPAVGGAASTATITFRQGQLRSNNGIIGLNANGAATVFSGMVPSAKVDYVVDVNGYFQ